METTASGAPCPPPNPSQVSPESSPRITHPHTSERACRLPRSQDWMVPMRAPDGSQGHQLTQEVPGRPPPTPGCVSHAHTCGARGSFQSWEGRTQALGSGRGGCQGSHTQCIEPRVGNRHLRHARRVGHITQPPRLIRDEGRGRSRLAEIPGRWSNRGVLAASGAGRTECGDGYW